jgi:formylglycine-generating enzyme required for sulfatase activity
MTLRHDIPRVTLVRVGVASVMAASLVAAGTQWRRQLATAYAREAALREDLVRAQESTRSWRAKSEDLSRERDALASLAASTEVALSQQIDELLQQLEQAGVGPARQPEAEDRRPGKPAALATVAELPQRIVNSIGLALQLLPPGTFHRELGPETRAVTITQPFYLGVYEVTNAEWKRVMGEVPSMRKDDQLPAESVSWDDATEFCRRLSELPEERAAGRSYRLPTEAEWEYGCRAGTTSDFSFGDDESLLTNFGWSSANSGKRAHPVGLKKPNPWGLYDMHGNVREWVSDWYAEYPDGEASDPEGPAEGSHRVSRGGSWYNASSGCRSASRFRNVPLLRFSLGVRIAMSPP